MPRGERRRRRDLEAARQARAAELLTPRQCNACANVYGSDASFQVHREGDRCLDGDARGQLVRRGDGAWCLLGSDAAAR